MACNTASESALEQAVTKKDLPLAAGQEIFRFDTFGDEQKWTDTLRMHEVIESSASPRTALAVGLKVDVTAVPPDVLATADLDDPATTVALIGLDAVVGVKGEVVDGHLVKVGITCALCHSTVDSASGIGNRLDGWPNRDLDPGAIIALSPAVTEADRGVYAGWGPGFYDPRFNVDGIDGPVVIPPAYGLQDVARETYTGDGPISYWNAYVAITQMGGKGDFCETRLPVDVCIDSKVDLVARKLPALLAYQLTLFEPPAPTGSYDVEAAARGQTVLDANGARCHPAPTYTDSPALHDPAETGMDPAYASRTVTGLYRSTPCAGSGNTGQTFTMDRPRRSRRLSITTSAFSAWSSARSNAPISSSS